MSKRSIAAVVESSTLPSDELVKKVKHDHITSFQDVLSILSSDEIHSIVQFLFVGEVLMLSMSNKRLYSQIESTVREYQPHVLGPVWSITKALRTRNKLTVSLNDQLTQLGNLVKEHKLEMSQLTDQLRISGQYFQDIPLASNCIQFLSTKITDSERQADVVSIEWCDDHVKTSMSYEDADYETLLPKKKMKIPITCASSLKGLNLGLNQCSRMELYQILSNCYALESLTVSVQDSSFYRQLTNVGDEETHPNTIDIPVLHSLKYLTIDNCYDYDTSIQFVVDLLQLAPNLESFEYIYTQDPDDRLLQHLAKQCPKLKKLYVQGDDGATPLENQFTDKGILNFMIALPELTELDLYHCCGVSGEVFTKIGQCGQKLQTLMIHRDAMNGDLCDQYHNVHFGGGELRSLKRLIFDGTYDALPDNFTDSIIKTAPNLTEIISEMVNIDKIADSMKNLISIDICQRTLVDVEKLTKLRSLETLSIEHGECPITINHLNSCSWSNLKNLCITSVLPPNPDDWLKALVKACPNLQTFEFMDEIVHQQEKEIAEKLVVFGRTLLELLKDSNVWPDLRVFRTRVESEKILALRPRIITETREDISDALESGPGLGISNDFERNWLVYDPYLLTPTNSLDKLVFL